MHDQPNERIAGLEARRTTLQIIIRLGREAQHGPLGEIERAEAHRVTWQAEQELEQIELELAKARCPRCNGGGEVAGFDYSGPGIGTCPVCKGTGIAPVDELQQRADAIYKGDRAEEINRGEVDG
jgi:hypothetical protein